MLVARSACSRNEDPGVAAREVADGLADLPGDVHTRAAVFFASHTDPETLERVGRAIVERSGIRAVVACSAASVVSSSAEPTDQAKASGISAVGFSGELEVERFLLPGLRGRSMDLGREIGRLAASSGQEDASVLLLADGYNLAPDELLSGIAEAAGSMPVIGAGASARGSTGEAAVAAEGVSAKNAVAGLVLRGLSIVPEVAPVFTPVEKWWTITRAEANCVFTLDDSPALPSVLETLPLTLQEDPAMTFAGLQIALAGPDWKEEPLLRPVIGGNSEDQSLVVGDEVFPGMQLALAIRDPVVAREHLGESLRRFSGHRRPEAVLYFHSAVAGEALYGLPALDTAYVRQNFGEIPLAGFASYLTVAPHRGRNRFHHSSGLLAGLARESPISDVDSGAR